MRKFVFVSVCGIALSMVGCSASEPIVVKRPEQDTTTGGAVPTTGMQSTPPSTPPASGGVSDAALAAQKKSYEKAKDDYTKNAKDAAKKSAYVKATDTYAYAMMMSETLSAHDKYSGALRLYREAHKADQNDADSQKWIEQIEGIYKQMGRPIPE